MQYFWLCVASLIFSSGATAVFLLAQQSPFHVVMGVLGLTLFFPLGVLCFVRLRTLHLGAQFTLYLQSLTRGEPNAMPVLPAGSFWGDWLKPLKSIEIYLAVSQRGLSDRQALYEDMEERLMEKQERLSNAEEALQEHQEKLQHSEYKVLEYTLALQHINFIQQKIQGQLNADILLQEATELLMLHLSVHRGAFLRLGDHQSSTVRVISPVNTDFEPEQYTALGDELVALLTAHDLLIPPDDDPEAPVPLLMLDKDAGTFLGVEFQSAAVAPIWVEKELWGAFCLFDKEVRVKADGQRFGQLGESEQLILQNVVAFLQKDLKNARLFEMATTDSLSQLYMRRYFENRMDDELRRLQRNPEPCALLMLDIDHFKLVNDNYGHQTGDEVIRQVSRVLRDVSRQGVDLPARYGGEEMVILLPQTSHEGAIKVAERIREAVSVLQIPAMEPKPMPQVTLSVGVSSYGTHGKTRVELVEAADQALYKAKASGRNQVCSAQEMTV
jgi:diguanylate cyclase (GGDEF)-like protein